jgi:hypothetical protein
MDEYNNPSFATINKNQNMELVCYHGNISVMRRGSVVGIATGHGLDDRGVGVRAR